VYNGRDSKTILTTGDKLEETVLADFHFGFMTKQADDSGRVVLTGDFVGGSHSLIVGIPV
jgi:hypothetical protein